MSAEAQQLVFPTDVRANSMGYVSTAWAKDATANANPAALSHTTGFQVSAAVRNRFLLEGLYDYGLFGSMELGEVGSVGIQIEHFGFEAFRQQTFAGSYGRPLSDRWSIGIKVSYLNIIQSEQDNASSINGSVGVLYRINEELLIGAEFAPFHGSSFENDIVLPISQKVGFSYSPSDIVSISGDLHYSSDTPQNWSAGVGLSYDIFDTVSLALGYRSNPDMFSFGIGWQVNESLMVNISSSFHQRLGASPMGGFVYRQ